MLRLLGILVLIFAFAFSHVLFAGGYGFPHEGKVAGVTVVEVTAVNGGTRTSGDCPITDDINCNCGHCSQSQSFSQIPTTIVSFLSDLKSATWLLLSDPSVRSFPLTRDPPVPRQAA